MWKKIHSVKILSILVILLCLLTGCSLPGNSIAVTATEPSATEIPTNLPQSSQTSSTTSPASLPDLPIISHPGLIQFNMLDVMNGWGTTDINLVRTIDGGKTWYDMTPPGVSSLGYSASVFFLDPLTGWVVSAGADFNSGTLEITTDGGSTWSTVPVPFAGGQIDFINATTGFILVGRGAAAGSQAVDVYSSADGGVNWNQVYSMVPGAGDNVNTLPFSGQKGGFAFLDGMHGWVGGSIPMDGYVYLFASSDGGHVWVKQDVALPVGYETAMTEVGSAKFFSNTDGVLPVRLMKDQTAFVFFISHDSGSTWISSSPILSNGQYSIASNQDFFVWDGGLKINVSHDGGQTWVSTSTNLDISDRLTKLVFLDNQTGWAVTADANNQRMLYKTLDGGATWTVLIP